MVAGPPNWMGVGDGMNVAVPFGGLKGLFALTMVFHRHSATAESDLTDYRND